jgi:hypothetical protein
MLSPLRYPVQPEPTLGRSARVLMMGPTTKWPGPKTRVTDTKRMPTASGSTKCQPSSV